MYKTLASAIATGALLVNAALPAFAVTIEISGNGSDSASSATVGVANTTTVVQSNTANVNNNVSAVASTGSNTAEDNTGGNVSVSTGNASTSVGVSNTLNSNTAEVNGCCDQDADVLISGNGEDSENNVDLGLVHDTNLYQTNVANVHNTIDAHAGTGDNLVEGTTDGDVSIETGDAETHVLTLNTANANFASLGRGDENGGSVSARILGNGTGSTNDIDLGLVRSVSLLQDNYANLQNDIAAVASTGGNTAEDNTGGTVSITTQDAETTVGVDNLVNFNSADLDCGCLLDVLAKISGNGEDSENNIEAELVDAQEAFQANVWTCDQGRSELIWLESPLSEYDPSCNNVDAFAGSGDNLASDNTGDPEGDPSIDAGDASTDVVIENTGNANVIGSDPLGDFPGFDFGFDLGDLGSNWLLLWGGLSGHVV